MQSVRRVYGGKSADQRRRERRAALEQAALRIWDEQGWAGVTMRGVCARAALSDRYFYENFPDRDALLAALWDQTRDAMTARLLMAIKDHGTELPVEQLRAALVALVHHIDEEPVRAQIIFGDHAGSAILEQRRRDTIQSSTDLVIALSRPYLRRRVDKAAYRTTVLVLIGGFAELISAWRSGLVDAEPADLVRNLVNVAAAVAPGFLRSDAVGAG